MSLSIYVIFHDSLDTRNYEQLTDDEFRLLTFVCVNKELTPKTYDRDRFTNILYEWDLPIYDPNLQRKHVCDNTMVPKSHFNETGVHWHLAVNKVCTTDYIYICHNDMIFTKGSVTKLLSLLAPGRGVTIARATYDQLVASSTFGYHEKEMYEYACTKLGITDRTKYYPLFTNCAMEREKFHQAMPALFQVNKDLFMTTLPGPSYRPAITYERTWALAMGDILDEIVVIKGILHAHPPIEPVIEQTRNGELHQYPEYSQ